MKNYPKKVDAVVKYFYPVAAGIETNMIETYSVLAKEGWDVTVHTSRDTLTEKNILPAYEEIRGIKVKRYPLWRFLIMPPVNFQKADVIALHNFNLIPHLTILFRALLAKITGTKSYSVVVTPHGGFNPEWSIFPRWITIIKPVMHYTLGTFLVNHAADGMRAVSEWEKREMISKGIKPDKIIVIDNGLEDEAYMDLESSASLDIKTKVAELGKYIIQIGRIYMIKNYETTIRALPLIPQNIKFVIVGPVGDNSYLNQLKALAKELKVSDRVIFFGVVRGVDKYYLIKKARMMVHMAIWESFCNVVHEGLSQGLVCVVANNTALPLLIKDGINGYCVETKDVKTVAEKINFVESHWNDAIILEMKKQNREIGLKNSWREVAGRMDDFYKKTLKQKEVSKFESWLSRFKRDVLLLWKNPKDYVYSFTYSNINKVKMEPFDPRIFAKGKSIIDKVKETFPHLKVYLLGSSALGIVGRKDIDLYIESLPGDFNKYLQGLIKIFGKPKKVRHKFVEWVTVIDGYQVDVTMADPTIRLFSEPLKNFQVLRNNKSLLEEYEEIKKNSDGVSVREYSRRKILFFNRILDH